MTRPARLLRRSQWVHPVLMFGVLVWLAVTLIWAAPVSSQPIEAPSEQSIKAAYLYKFADYVEWPPDILQDPAAPLIIGVLADDPLAGELEDMTRGRLAHGHAIQVRRIAAHESLDGVHVLFVGSAATANLPDLLSAARRNAILVVTEVGNALQLGSVINFRAIDQRIRFEVSLDSADQSGLKLSSRLLAVAVHVQPREHR